MFSWQNFLFCRFLQHWDSLDSAAIKKLLVVTIMLVLVSLVSVVALQKFAVPWIDLKYLTNGFTFQEMFKSWKLRDKGICLNLSRLINFCDFCLFRFYEKHQMPGVIGCIDCTHVAIVAPPVDHEQYPERVYVNRKNYHSINVQLVSETSFYMNCDTRKC